jgi:Ca2+-transporting ATPase
LATLASLGAMALVLFTPVKIAFGLATLPAWLYAVGFGLAAVPLFVMEIAKLIEHVVQKKKAKKEQTK